MEESPRSFRSRETYVCTTPEAEGGVGASVAIETGTPAPVQSLRTDARELPDAVDLAPTPPTIVAASDTFDWDDAGIGLAGGLGLALVLVGALAAAQHARRMPGAS